MRELSKEDVNNISGGILSEVAAFVAVKIGFAIGRDFGCAIGGNCPFTPVKANQ